MLTIVLFLPPHHLACGSPTYHSLPQGLSTLPSDRPPTLSSQWLCTASSSSSFIFQEPFCPGLHSTSVSCLPFCVAPLLLTLPDRFVQETLEMKV